MLIDNATLKTLKLPAGKMLADDHVRRMYLRGTAGGGISFLIQYTARGAVRRFVFGAYPAMTLHEARKAAKELLAKVDYGNGDPAGEREARRRAPPAAMTFGMLIHQFIASKASKSAATIAGYELYLGKHCAPLHARELAGLSKLEVSNHIEHVRATRSPTTARMMAVAISAFLTYAVKRGIVAVNVASVIEKPDAPAARKRYLSHDELATVWDAVSGADDYSRICRVLILTGQRLNEIAGLKWSEVDMASRVITFDAARLKTRERHLLPISDAMFAVLKDIPVRAGSGYVFGRGTGPFRGSGKAHGKLLQRLGADFPHWTPHDLRRTFRTLGSKLGIAPHVLESIMAHAKGAVGKAYDLDDMLDQKRHALDAYAGLVTDRPEASNVVRIRA
jgi:integrase